MVRCKITRVGTFYVAVIRGESCFEKNAFEDTENPHPPTKTRLPVKEYRGKYSIYRKHFCFILKLFLRPILFHGKLSFDNLTYFKLYGILKGGMRPPFTRSESRRSPVNTRSQASGRNGPHSFERVTLQQQQTHDNNKK